jgi:outer membrane protein assembly factor BamB/plastocyanin
VSHDPSSVEQEEQKRINRRLFLAGGGAAAIGAAALLSHGGVFAQDQNATPAAVGGGASTPEAQSGIAIGGSAKSNPNLPKVPPEVADASGNWPTAQGNLKATRVAVDSAIKSDTVSQLKPEWYFSLADRTGFTATPIVTKDTIYIQDMKSNVVALDRASGEVKWETKFGVGTTGPNGVAIGYGILAATLGDLAEVVGLDPATGEEKWRTQIGIPPGEGVDMSPLIYDGTVFVSSIPGTTKAFYQRGQVGVLYALDALTGDKLWGFNTVADNGWNAPALNGGGGLWYPPSVDDDGNLYFGIGNPAPWPSDKDYPNGSNRPGDNLYTDSMVSLDKTTAGVRWYVQAQPHDILDHDFQQTPVLTTASINGADTLIAIGAGKTGTVIAADASTGAMLWKTAVGKHQNDDLKEIPSGVDTVVFPGIYGGVETPLATDGGLVFAAYVDYGAAYSDSSTFSTTTVIGLDQSAGGLIALNVADGTVKWEVKFNSMQIAGATVSNDVVFTAGLDGMVNGYKVDTGEPVFSWQAPAGINAPVVVAGDTLYVGAGAYPVLSHGIEATPIAEPEGTPAAAVPTVVQAFIALKIGGKDVEIVPPAGAATPAPTVPSEVGAKPVTVNLIDIRFDPKAFTIPANTATTVNLVNQGATVHNFNIDELNIASGDLAPGATTTVTINASAGSYTYYCNIPGHREAGMVGTLTVQ